MIMLNCIAVDDEPLALELIKDMIQKIPFLNLKGTFGSVKQARSFLENENIDLLFLDIQMPGINGLDFAKTLDFSQMVIFTTAFDQYAIDGFEVNAVDYLMKPIDKNRLLIAAEKANQLYYWRCKENEKNFILINSEHTVFKVLWDHITHIEGMKDYVKIFTTTYDKPILTRMNLKTIEKQLDSIVFLRVHKSYIVNCTKISAREKDLLSLSDIKIPIGNTYKEELKERMKIYK